MNLVAWIIAGTVIGWVAHLSLKNGMRQWLVMDIVAGAVGAFIGGNFFGPMIGGAADPQAFHITSFVVAVAGALVLLVVTRMLRKAASQ